MPESLTAEQYNDTIRWGMRENVWQVRVVKLARQLGWKAYHTYISDRSTAGYFDLTLIKPGRRVAFVELKRMNGQLSPAQVDWLETADRADGCDPGVWRPSHINEIEEYLTAPHWAMPSLPDPPPRPAWCKGIR